MRGSSLEVLWPLPHSRSFLARGYFLDWIIPGLSATATLLPLLPSPPFSFFLSRRLLSFVLLWSLHFLYLGESGGERRELGIGRGRAAPVVVVKGKYLSEGF